MINPKVSVIMSVFNEREEWIKESINSILKQTLNDFEFIIVLDSKDDKLLQLLNEYAEMDRRIIIIDNKENYGLVYSLNKAIELSRGEFIARMDSDDISLPFRLEHQLQECNEKDVDFIFSDVNILSESGKIKKIKRSYFLPVDHIFNLMKFGNISKHPTWFLKKKIYVELDGYRNISNSEDYDFILRALLNGYNIIKSKEIVLNYRVRESSISRKNGLDQFMKARKIRYSFKTRTLCKEVPKFKSYSLTQETKFGESQKIFNMFIETLGESPLRSIMYLFKSLSKSKYTILKFVDMLVFKINENRIRRTNIE